MERHYEIEAHKKEIYEKIPKYRELENKIASESIKLGIASLSGNTSSVNSISDLEKTIYELTRQRDLLLTEAGYPADYLNPPYKCPYCQDTGYIGNERCLCYKQLVMDATYQNSYADMLIKSSTFENISHEYHTADELTKFIEAEEASKDFVNNFKTNHKNILFKGTSGTGKSFLSNCIANALIAKGYSVIYFSSASLFDRISSYFFCKDKYLMDNPMTDICNCDLLIIDDLGSEFTNQFVISELFSIINERSLRKKSTVISTNLDFKELHSRYTEKIFSRLYSNFDTYDLRGNDIRTFIKRVEQHRK